MLEQPWGFVLRMNTLLAYRDDYRVFLDRGDDAPPELRTRIMAVAVRAAEQKRAEEWGR